MAAARVGLRPHGRLRYVHVRHLLAQPQPGAFPCSCPESGQALRYNVRLRMRIGIPSETRDGEARVAATPETIRKFIAARHTVSVQVHAGIAAGIPDADFQAAGAALVPAAAQIY